MKTNLKNTVAVLAVVTLFACKENTNKQSVSIDTPAEVAQAKEETPDMTDATFADGMTGKVWQNYLQTRTAFVHSDAAEVKTAMANLAESFGPEREELKNIATEISNTDGIEAQRALFATLTDKLEPLFTQGLSDGAIYKQFCPMAFNGEGGYWLSDVSEIRNPYFGDRMLTCGKVVKTIEK